MASLESSRLDGQTGDVETEVPKSARWLYCGEPDDRQKAVLGKDCGTRADFRVALPSPPAHYLELAQSPRYPAILPFLGHARTLLRTLPRSLIHPFHPPRSRVPSLFCQLMTFPQSFCDNFCPEATPPPISLFTTGPGLPSIPLKVGQKLPCLRHGFPDTMQFFPHYTLLVLFLPHSWVTFTVQFSNGKLQNPGNMRFTLYNSNDVVNPRLRNQRILVSAEFRLSELCKALQKTLGVGRYERAQAGEKKEQQMGLWLR